MFQQTFVTEGGGSRRSIGVLFSLTLQLLALASLILFQLFYSQPIPTAQLRLLLIGPPAPVSQPRPTTTSHAALPTPARRVFTLTAPVAIPKTISRSADFDSPAPPDTGVVGTLPGTTSASDPLIGITKGAPQPEPPPEPVNTASRGPMKMGGTVAAANLIHQVQPIYPPLARSARVEGTVEFTAIIDKTGRVVNLQLLHGHPLLVHAAQDAILQWRYKPTTLNGQPVDVLTSITVHFHLSN